MLDFSIQPGALSPADVAWYQSNFKDCTVTGSIFNERYLDMGYECSIGRLIVTGPYTPFECCRDCGDHYIIARYSRFDSIDKVTGAVIEDVEDL